ncbi:MAG: alpha/beta hydrolase [Stenomitos frigidus ULC029]
MAVLTNAVPDITQFNLTPMSASEADQTVLGYYVNSTAAINIEDNPLEADNEAVIAAIGSIADYLIASPEPQIVISIHGYGTQRSDAEKRYQKIYRHATKICQPQTSVFLGYLWPSEKPTGDRSAPTGDRATADNSFGRKIKDAFSALPILLSGLFWGGLLLTVAIATLLIATDDFNGLLTPLLIGSVLVSSGLLTLILLRLSTYFRDNYRATNYGVLDLVELIRQIDQAVAQKLALQEPSSEAKRIKLSFLGHSMGCFIVTNTIRILSDVFDAGSINQNPPAEIGRVFRLERLILIAPDIPAESIMPRRSNFLRSSLRRCKEAYVFSNEGDLALRLASTTANYFSFPARKRSSGYRLGNVTVKHFSSKADHQNRLLDEQDYGIVNRTRGALGLPFKYLEVRASDREHHTLEELRGNKVLTEHLTDAPSVDIVADLFTYFDCTDYVDFQDELKDSEQAEQPRGVVSFALRKAALNLADYARLNISYFKQSLGFGGINVHGGYFNGVWSQQVIYGLAFLGFQRFLVTLLEPSASDRPAETLEQKLNTFSITCQQKGIQVVLAPIRYEKDVNA